MSDQRGIVVEFQSSAVEEMVVDGQEHEGGGWLVAALVSVYSRIRPRNLLLLCSHTSVLEK